MGDEGKVSALAGEVARNTNLLQHEREALDATQAFRDPLAVYQLIARVDVLGAGLHRRLVEWHSRHPDRPSLGESDAFWADLKELRAAKEQLATVLAAVEARERQQPTLRTQLERATSEVGDVERFFSTYLDRINAR